MTPFPKDVDQVADWLENWLRECTGLPSLAALQLKKHILSAPDSVRLELAALLNPWRKGLPPEYPDMITDAIETTKDGRWRYILPAAPPSEDKLK